MTKLRITWVYDAADDGRAPRVNLGRDEQLINEIGRCAGISIPFVEGRLPDVGPQDGFILWNAHGRDLAEPFAADTAERAASLVDRFANRLIQIDASTSRIFIGLERLCIAAAIDVESHRHWARGASSRAQGIYGRRETAEAIGAVCDDQRHGSEHYCYIVSDRHDGLPHLLADYLSALNRLE